MMNFLLWSVTLLLAVTAVYAEPIASQDIYVLDGNTVDVHGQHIRLVGFDAPEEGQRARCATFVCGQYSCPKRMSWCPLETPE